MLMRGNLQTSNELFMSRLCVEREKRGPKCRTHRLVKDVHGVYCGDRMKRT